MATSIAPKKRPQEETMVGKPLQDLQEKVVDVQAVKHRKKATLTKTGSLEVHRSFFFL
jgi:hypothetical protein